MASLRDIINEEPQTDGKHSQAHIKRDKGGKPANLGLVREATPTNQEAHPRHGQGPAAASEQDINQSIPAPPQSKRRAVSSRGSKPSAAGTGPSTTTAAAADPAAVGAASSSSSSPSSHSLSLSLSLSLFPSQSTSATGPPLAHRRPSTASNDSMDQAGGYGSAASSSSMGGGIHSTNSPMRPMPAHPPVMDMPMRLTPITGRVSRAKKGMPVHVCSICKPAKTFTRAEHLRRHQLSHQTPRYPCTYPGCDKAFHRADLLLRHQQKHEREGDKASSKSGQSRGSPHASPPDDDGYGSNPSRSNSISQAPSHQQPPPGGPSPSAPGARSGPPASPSMTRPQPAQNYPSGYALSTSAVGIMGHTPDSYSPYPPRTSERALFLDTVSAASHAEMPDLRDASPWASDSSAYSTPASEISRQPRPWPRQQQPTLMPFPTQPSRSLQSPGPNIDTIAVPTGPYYGTYAPNPTSQSAFSMVSNLPHLGFVHDAVGHPGLPGHHHHQPGTSISSVRSTTPPPNTSSHANDTLVTPATTLPTRMDQHASLGRKELMLEAAHQGILGRSAVRGGGMSVSGSLGGGGYGGSGSASPGGDNDNHGGAIMTGIDMGGCAMSGPPSTAITLSEAERAAIPGYLEVFWTQAHQVLPVVHRRSFEAAPAEALKCAMAAVATQYLDHKDDRTRGTRLHAKAWQDVKRTAQWSIQTMQTILLCEHFARFRGRIAVTRPSEPFESLYSRVVYDNPTIMIPAMPTTDSHLPLQTQWQNWIEIETRRRLLTVGSFINTHAAMYQQQVRVGEGHDDASPLGPQMLPLLGRSKKLWDASSAEEWASLLAADPKAGVPELLPPLEQLGPEDIASRSPEDRLVILSALANRLPRRQGLAVFASGANSPTLSDLEPHEPRDWTLADAEERIATLFRDHPIANTYLALHHTPLRDLLAVSGDSWVFSQKVLLANNFTEHRNRLRFWAGGSRSGSISQGSGHSLTTASTMGNLTSLNAAQATVYAARAILGFLERPYLGREQSAHAWSVDLSDYWALYVCALICWAYTYRTRGPAMDQQHRRGNSGGASPASRGATAPGSVDEEALRWLRDVAADGIPLDDVARLRGQREAAGVVGLVRQRLESDCIGQSNRLYEDSVGVLKKLDDGYSNHGF